MDYEITYKYGGVNTTILIQDNQNIHVNILMMNMKLVCFTKNY